MNAEFNENTARLTGFDIQNAFKALSFYFPFASIFSDSSNIAGSTNEYIINRSQSQLAEIANVSLRTASRHCTLAEKHNMVEVLPVYNKENGARLANVYKLTANFLSFARQLRNAIKPKRLSIGNHVKAVKAIISKLLINIKFKPTPPTPNCHIPPRQNGVANNKYKPLEVRETVKGASDTTAAMDNQPKETTEQISPPAKAPMSNKILRECLAKGVAKRVRERKQEKLLRKRKYHAKVQREATKLSARMNWFKQSSKPVKNDSAFKSDYSDVNYTTPKGFRTC
ncbi:hypothetical protein [Rosenbergiella metrosideri]|uniref:hypothetical protein n=1 Tax=Rosenbergiella metrosideri TaxID=2921185 RepID=UPI001F4FE366|nr:hypothetical protein [Rosenbergiella metrosideri]